MLGVPDSVEREVSEREVRVGDRLACQFSTIAILIAHGGALILNFDANYDKPILSANFCDMAWDSVHDPVAARLLGQVLGAICQ